MSCSKLEKSWKEFLKRCEERNLVCEFDYDHFYSLKKIRRCYYTGLFLCNCKPFSVMSPTLERVDRTKGYTVENTVVCSLLFNGIKGGVENPKVNCPKDEIIPRTYKMFFENLKKRKKKLNECNQ